MTHKAQVTPRNANGRYWSDMQVSCEVDGWRAKSRSYAEQVAEYQRHKKVE